MNTFGARLPSRLLILIPLSALGVLVLSFGVRNSEIGGVVLGCVVVAAQVIGLAATIASVAIEHRRQLTTGWLLTLPVTYGMTKIGSSVDRTTGEHRATIGTGEANFARAVDAVMRWEIKTRSGFRVIRVGEQGAYFSDDPVATGDAAVVRLGPVVETVQVVRVVREQRRRGFAYGTLPEHPLIGEEAFLVEWRDDDRVDLVIRSFSRPNGLGWTLLWPLTAIARQVFIRRYLRALVD